VGSGRLDAVDATLADLEASSAKLAQALLDLESRAGRVLPVAAGSAGRTPVTGQTAACVGRVRDRLDWLWDRFSTLSEVLSRARNLRAGGTRLASRRIDELDALLHRASVPRRGPPPHPAPAAPAAGAPAPGAPAPGAPAPGAGGGVSTNAPAGAGASAGPGIACHPSDLLTGTAETVAATIADLDALEAACFGNPAALTTAERELADVVATAERIGVGPTAESAAARSALDAVAAATSADPMSVSASDLAAVAEAVRRAADATAELRRAHDSLVDDLHAAAGLLDEIVAVAAAGQESARTVVERVTGTDAGLLRLDDGWFDDPRRGLRPWLDRLRAHRAAGDWRRAGRGLAAWREVADSTLAAARRVAEANAAPLNRRDELRGLLRALQTKAVRNGLAEAPELDVLFRRARETLYTSPIDLDAADDLVRSYAARLVECADRKERTP
jgi:hypothetical protein